MNKIKEILFSSFEEYFNVQNNAKEVKYKNGTYIGFIKNKQRHGFGKFTWDDGDEYIGEWKEDLKCGKGIFTDSNGSNYEGQFKNDEKNGKGTLVKNSGEKYIGDWKNGKRHGQGTNIFLDGKIFIGQWFENLMHGKVCIITDQDLEDQNINTQNDLIKANVGEWIKGKQKNITSVIRLFKKLEDGSYKRIEEINYSYGKYIGEWGNGKRHGFGKFTWDDGDEYIGEWKDGEPHGFGRFYWKNGNNFFDEMNHQPFGVKIDITNEYVYDEYIGEWKDGERFGFGLYLNKKNMILKWKNNEGLFGIYDEEYNSLINQLYQNIDYKKQQKDFEFSNVDNMEGDVIQWIGETGDNYAFHKTKVDYGDGGEYIGTYKNGHLHGFCQYTWHNGKKYIGEFKGGVMHGFGILYSPDGNINVGEWELGNCISSKDINSLNDAPF